MFKTFITAITIFLFSSAMAFALPVFPSAEGFGVDTIGGRGGTVIHVTNLDNTGTGSLRAALTASGARIVVFDTGGTIALTSDIIIFNPYLTVAGQTAPGDGIMIKGATVQVATHDVLIRNLRIRVGLDAGDDSLKLGAVPADTVYNVVIDHCSLSWAEDEDVSTVNDVDNITFSWNIISEGLEHPVVSYGLLVGDHGKNVSIHHNYFAHNYERNPVFKGDSSGEVVNNVVYNYNGSGARFAESVEGGSNDPSQWQIMGNYFKHGNDTPSTQKGIKLTTPKSGTELFVENNIGYGRPTNTGTEWDAVDGDNTYQVFTEPLLPLRITEDDVDLIVDIVLASDGAGAIIPSRDSIDARIVADFAAVTGVIIADEDEVGGYPTYATGSAPTDTDNDGMPNSWETAEGTNPSVADDDLYTLNGSYTNIEVYINGLMGEISASNGDSHSIIGIGTSVQGVGVKTNLN